MAALGQALHYSVSRAGTKLGVEVDSDAKAPNGNSCADVETLCKEIACIRNMRKSNICGDAENNYGDHGSDAGTFFQGNPESQRDQSHDESGRSQSQPRLTVNSVGHDFPRAETSVSTRQQRQADTGKRHAEDALRKSSYITRFNRLLATIVPSGGHSATEGTMVVDVDGWGRIAWVSPFGFYVHIPFCAKRCDYCAFATWTDRDHLIERYVAACRKDLAGADLPVATSVFFGGGTPSIIAGELLMSILGDIARTDDAEVTVECNPDTVTQSLFDTYANAGVNRVSLGVQSMVPHVLKSLGRSHDVDNVKHALACAANAGIDRVNVDVIYGAVGETIDDWRRTVEEVLALTPLPKHVSAYALTVEPGTPLSLDKSRFPDDDDQAEKYEIVDTLLNDVGLPNYEISNWSAPGEECRHNILYWEQGNYRGIGCAAHSHVDGRRWWNLRTPERYIAAVESGATVEAADEVLDAATRKFEMLELAMRMRYGVPESALPVEDLHEFLDVRNGRAILNRRGRLMAGEIATRLRV